MNHPRWILHVDMDAFYAAVEQRDHADFRGKPVVVGAAPRHGRGRGVVSTASYEARKFGIHSAQPISEAWRKCPNAIFLPVRMSRYVDVSRQIMNIASGYSPLIEKISLDEAFLDITGTVRLMGSPDTIGRRLKEQIVGETQLTASVGIGPNKLIAKIASDYQKPDGLTIVPHQEARTFLTPLPIRRLWGIGAKTEKKLRTLGVSTIGDLARLDPDFLIKQFGKWGRCLYNYACGIDESTVVPYRDAKSISNEVTFHTDEHDREMFRQTLLQLCDKVGFRLRSRHLMARTVTIKVRFSDFSTLIRSSTLPQPVFLSETIYHEVFHLFETIDIADRSLRLLGVGVSHLISARAMQGDLFDGSGDDKSGRITDAMDALKNKYGRDIIQRGT
ncbi:DNA polymerase IV [bacterium]|nr:DNA polymerase IV [bacterium]